MAKVARKCLVTGACGFIGSHMVETLVRDGHEVIATDLPAVWEASGRVARMNVETVRRCAARVVAVDLTVPGALDEAVRGVDFVFHLASVSDARAPWSTLYRVNVQGTANLLDSVERADPDIKRLVVWSAAGVSGLSAPDGSVLTEEAQPNPPSNYLKSKWFQEFLAIERCRRAGIRWTALRPTVVVGTRQTRGLPTLLRLAYRSPVVMVPANLGGHLSLAHVEDVCGAALHLAKYPSGANGVFHVCSDSGLTMVDLCRHLAGVFEKPFLTLPSVPERLLRFVLGLTADVNQALARRWRLPSLLDDEALDLLMRNILYSNEKLKKAGYRPRHEDMKPVLSDLARWYAEQGLL